MSELKEYFITATDTDAGKTLVSTALTKALVANNNKVAVFKPISAGCELIENVLVNDDAKQLMDASNSGQTIQNVNPIAYLEPIAPHIAAKSNGDSITVNSICNHYQDVKSLSSEFIITEGAGGWRLPLGNGDYLSSFVKKENLDVILIVDMKLGCLNHATLTYESIINDGLNVIAWVANSIAPMNYLEENIQLLKETINAPLLARIGHVVNTDAAVELFNLELLN